MNASQQHTRAIVCQIQKITEHALKNDSDRLAIRAAFRNALLAVLPERPSGQLTWYDRFLVSDMPEAAELALSRLNGGDAA
jgi:hypothetical protein